ncbi:prestin-like isoform X1 [Apostichopus japonicus]|uniref:prestin-like isoform X1 n=1 Tax=Stichopus japonicus TaxID=307972 RepID=UPI003AB7901A
MEEEGVPAESISNIDLDLELRHRNNVVVNRPLYSEDEFRKDFKVRERQKASVPDKVKSWVKPGDINKKSVKKFFFGLIPILAWLPKYGLRKQLLPDVISGFTVGVYRLPQGMAHAILATVPPVYGLYTVFFPVIVYALFGTSKHISIGSFAVVSIMTGDAADKVIEQISKDRDLTEAEEQEARIQAVTSLALMVGVIQIVLGILHFGIISDYLPEPLIRGFTTGAGVTVFTSQFNKMFGVPVGDVSGPLSILRQYIPFFGDLRYCNTTEIIVSICSILLMVVIKEVQEKFKTKYTVFKYPIPIELVVIVLGTLVSYFLDLNGKFGVAIVGDVPTGLPGPSFPSFEYVPYLISDAFVIAIVTFSIAVSMAYIFGKKHNYEIGANQELFAYGASNFVGSLFQCFPNTASLSRSLVQEVSGCTSQISSLVSAVLILITLLWLGPLFQTLPECCLAAIIVVALRGMFRQCKDLKILWKYSKTDFIIWIITFLAVITFGLDIGLLTGVAFSIFTVVVRTQRPPCFVMGCIPDTDIYKDVKQFDIVKEVPGIKIFRIQAPLYFSNARYIKDLLYRKTEVSPPKILIQRAKLAKRAEAAAVKAKEAYANEVDTDMENGKVPTAEEVVTTISKTNHESEPEQVHTVILDFGTVSFIDTVGMNTMKTIITEYDSINVNVLVANVRGKSPSP